MRFAAPSAGLAGGDPGAPQNLMFQPHSPAFRVGIVWRYNQQVPFALSYRGSNPDWGAKLHPIHSIERSYARVS
jgi:hypothetical protein